MTIGAKNSVLEGIRRHGLVRNFFLELKERIAAGKGLTAQEWDWYNLREKEYEHEKERLRSNN